MPLHRIVVSNIFNPFFVAIYLVVQFKHEEITAIMNDFSEPGTLAPTGLFLGGTKYMVIQGEPGAVIRGKKVKIYIVIIEILAYVFIDMLLELSDDKYYTTHA